MLNVCTGTVVEVLERTAGRVKLRMAPDHAPDDRRRAIQYTDLSGPIEVGDRVLVNTTAVDLALGTGGWDFVVANLTRAGGPARYGESTTGHLVKLRYAPNQIAVAAAEESGADLPRTLEGRPVVAAALHSQIAPVAVGFHAAVSAAGLRSPRIAYVMVDAGALPLALSDTIPLLRERGLISSTITCGQAFGGEFEAVALGSGLLIGVGRAAADLLLVVQGPGHAGTATSLGFGGLYQAEALHLATALGGDPILVARISAADARPRHHGVSHHTRTLLDRILLTPVTVAVPDGAPDLDFSSPDDASDSPKIRHTFEPAPTSILTAALHDCGLPMRSMGRGLDEDLIFFLAAAAGGWVAGQRHARRVNRERAADEQ